MGEVATYPDKLKRSLHKYIHQQLDNNTSKTKSIGANRICFRNHWHLYRQKHMYKLISVPKMYGIVFGSGHFDTCTHTYCTSCSIKYNDERNGDKNN